MRNLRIILGLFFLLIGIHAFAYDFQSGGIYYNILEGKNVEVTSGDGKYKGGIVIPDIVTYNGTICNVTSIGKDAFYYCYDLISIALPNSLTTIGEYAFGYCTSLEELTIPEGVTSIDSYAFEGCSALKIVNIPNSITTIKFAAFRNCSSLISLSFPKSLKTIGDYVFQRCNSLISIDVDPNNEYFKSVSGVLYNKEGTEIICYPASKSGSQFTIPRNVNKIAPCAFGSCSNLTSIIIHDDITDISSYAFEYCNKLTAIKIPYSVKSIGNMAFLCSGLISVNIPYSVQNIYAGAFAGCSDLSSIVVDSNNTRYDSRNGCNAIIMTSTNTLIAGCKNTTIPNTVSCIGQSAFEGSNLTSIMIPNSVTSIKGRAFFGCSSLVSIVIPNTVTSIGEWAFRECTALISINLPNSVKSIGNCTFYDCYSLTSITLPNSLTEIGTHAFRYCYDLTSIVIPSSVSKIGSYAFGSCRSLTSVVSEIVKPFEISENVFSNYSKPTLTVPRGTKSSYQSTNYWNKFTNIVEAEADNTFGEVADVVDLGLSVKWASWNIGASKIGDYGGLYGAGDPTGKKTSTNVSDYYFNDGGSICGTEYDLAHVKWGDLWRMPKWSELEELKTKCTWTNGEVEGVKGSWVKGPNGNSIFLPWAGNRKGTSTFSGKGSYGYYWSGDMGVSLHSYGYKDLDIGSGGVNQTDGAENYWGQSIRPVYGDSNNGSNTSTKRTIHVATAGTLPNLISESEKYTIEELTLTGELNGTDFRLLRDMAGCNYLGKRTEGKLTVLDLMNAKIVAGGEKYLDTNLLMVYNAGYGGNYYYNISQDNIIPTYVFAGCCLKVMQIPNSVNIIDSNAFWFCHDLTSITIPNSVKTIGDKAFQYCSALISFNIPNSVTIIGDGAFYDCSGLTSITIPNSVTSIGDYAFCSCTGLTSISIPNSVTSIGSSTFNYCSGLNSIEIDNGNAKYDSRNGCNAIIETASNTLIAGCKNTTIPNTVTSLGRYAFYGCSSLTSIAIPNSVISIANSVFNGCSGLTSITIPNSVTSISNSAFSGCSGLTSIKVEGGNMKYDSRDGCNAIIVTSTNNLIAGCKNTVIPNTVTSLGRSAFSGCSSLTSIMIPNSVTKIGEWVFNSCTGLTSITIPNSVTSIGDYAFNYCIGLSSVISEIVRPFEIPEDVFNNSYTKATLTVPSGTKSAYQSTAGWNKFTNIVEKKPEQSTTITAKSYTREYGDANPSFTYTVSGGTISGTPKITCSAIKTSSVGSYTIKIEKGSVTNSNVTFVDGTLTITKAPLTITAKSYTRKQGESNPSFDVTYSGFKNNETSSVLTRKPTCSTTATSSSSPGIYDINVSGATATNYDITYVKGTLTVTNADAIVLTARSYTREYGDANPTFGYTKSGATLNGTPTITCSATRYSPVGTYPIKISQGSVSNYNVTYEEGTLTITKAPLTITAKSYTRKQGESNPSFDVTYSGFKNGESSSDLDRKPTCSTTATSSSSPGTYDINVSGASATNYDISYVKGKLTVTKADAVIVTARNYTREYGEDNPSFGYTTSGATLLGSPSITCSATRYSPVGTYPIRIAQGSISNYNVTYVDGTLTITKAPLSITAKSYTREEGQSNPTFEVTYSGFKNGETESVLSRKPSVSTEATASSPIGTYSLVPYGAQADNYNMYYYNGTLTITEKSTESVYYDGITYLCTNATRTAEVQSVDYGMMNVEIPYSFSHNGKTYQVTSIANGALSNRTFDYVSLPSTVTTISSTTFSNSRLGALIWNANSSLPSSVFNNMAMLTNSNFLLYVNSRSYAPSNVSNVVVGSTASSITLKDGIDTRFYCPKAFTAQNISYTHHYGMTTGGKGKGWETIALPFHVQRIEHKTKGVLTPFALYNDMMTQRPFWLYELGSNGFRRTDAIKANTPYIIAMPNDPKYDEEYILAGDVTFSATNATVLETGSLTKSSSKGMAFIPAFAVKDKASSVYALNVSNELVYNSSTNPGSEFVSNLRRVYPFEAYMTTSSSAARSLSIVFDDGTTGIDEIPQREQKVGLMTVYTLTGMLMFSVPQNEFAEKWQSLPSGVYIVNGQKMIISDDTK